MATTPKKPPAPKAQAVSQKAFDEQSQIAAVTASSGQVLIGCKLPCGIVLEHPINPDIKFEIAGLNKIAIIGAPYATTRVPMTFWSEWMAVHYDFAPFKSGAIFQASDLASLQSVASELEKVATGFEPMAQTMPGIEKAKDD